MSDSYGAGPYNPMPGEPARGPITKGPAPAPVTNATRLMFIQAALGVVSIILTLATKDSLKDAIKKSDSTLTAKEVNDAVNLGITVGVVLGVILLVLYVLLAIQVGKGKNWARVVTWVLVGLFALLGLLSFAQPETTISRIFSVIGLIINIAIIVLLAQKPSNEYFRKRV